MLQRDAGQHGGPVPGPGHLGRVAADSALPHMTVSIHHAGDHEAAGRFDHLSGFGRGLKILADGDDDSVCHEDVTRWQVAQFRVDRHDVAALYQEFSRHGPTFLPCVSSRGGYRRSSRPRPAGAPVIPWRYQGWEDPWLTSTSASCATSYPSRS